MKKVLSVLICCFIMVSMVACSVESKVVTVNVENDESLSGKVFGETAMIKIGNGLYYDSTTRIVYWWNGNYGSDWATTPTPYYAPNGLPYLYNPETNTFEDNG